MTCALDGLTTSSAYTSGMLPGLLQLVPPPATPALDELLDGTCLLDQTMSSAFSSKTISGLLVPIVVDAPAVPPSSWWATVYGDLATAYGSYMQVTRSGVISLCVLALMTILMIFFVVRCTFLFFL